MIVEIRTYQIKPGERDEFVRVMRTQSVPLLQKFGIAVLDCGPSLVDEDGAETAYLIRAFPAREIRDEQETTFYASPQWRRGPREAIVSRIESSHTVVLEMPAAAVEALRR
ncbi:NIPSNAP family protein [Catellatospora chokoriensis]|uniref:NIPSNAP family protein n=1 Tax=Catellatospora chokoriensis TaxID=310353 RepID=UPI0017803D4C|nr:NIPSNAP family protein [Catellatospora chokoriensis]